MSGEPEGPELAELEASLGHRFADPGLLEAALCHASYSHEIDGSRGNERLEFLGDAVLDLVVARLLFDAHPDWSEGDLTRARAALVDTRSLAEHAGQLGVGRHARLGRTERRSGGEHKPTVLAAMLEALLGAVYLDGGLEPLERLARRLFAEVLDPAAPPLPADPKTRFQEWAHAELQQTPHYSLIGDSGVENDERRFEVEVHVEADVWGRGHGRTKRAAERAAAGDALSRCKS